MAYGIEISGSGGIFGISSNTSTTQHFGVKVVTRFSKGYKKRVWMKLRDRNEALDTAVYCLAAYAIINIDVNVLASKIEARTEEPTPVAPEVEPTPVVRRRVSRPRQNYVNSWR